MKNTIRVLSLLLAVMLCVGMFAACDKPAETDGGSTKASAADSVPSTGAVDDATEPFVAPPDQVGKIVSADATLVTWYAYTVGTDTVDFMNVDLTALGDSATEMSLLYMEEEVTYYTIVDGKLAGATVDDVVADSIIGVTTLEEGVQEVYILYAPEADDGSDDYEDVLEDIVEDTVPDETTAEENGASEDDTTVDEDAA